MARFTVTTEHPALAEPLVVTHDIPDDEATDMIAFYTQADVANRTRALLGGRGGQLPDGVSISPREPKVILAALCESLFAGFVGPYQRYKGVQAAEAARQQVQPVSVTKTVTGG